VNSLVLKTPAKINLGLTILKKLPNHYHEVKTIYCQVNLFDLLTIKKLNQNSIKIKTNNKSLANNDKNLVYQAAKLLKNKTGYKKGASIILKKNIPISAGLGGGSSNAALTLKGLNKLWQLNLPLIDLIKLGKEIGADVAYQLVGGVKLEYQGGKKAGRFYNLNKLPKCFILLCIPDIRIKSKIAYLQVNYDKIAKNNLILLIKAIKQKNIKKIASTLHNDFEIWTFKKYPIIKEIKNKMLKYGALGSLMSGKGPAVFGIFNDFKKTKIAYNFFQKKFNNTFMLK